MKLSNIFGLYLLLILLSSCATMSKEECKSASWNLLGYEAAMKGKMKTHFNSLNQQCTEHGIKADEATFLKGYSEGLKSFCTYDNGHAFGYADKDYMGICPVNLERDFLRGFKLGKAEFENEEMARKIEEQEDELRKRKKKKWDSSNCAHIRADGTCAHEI